MSYAIDIDRQGDAAAWSKLAHVHGIGDDFQQANVAASEALRISPDDQPYLFEKGYIEYRMGNQAEAAHAFAASVKQAELTNDSFYLDAARIAQARCLALDGRARLAANVIAAAVPDSATWLDGRFSKEEVLKLISGSD